MSSISSKTVSLVAPGLLTTYAYDLVLSHWCRLTMIVILFPSSVSRLFFDDWLFSFLLFWPVIDISIIVIIIWIHFSGWYLLFYKKIDYCIFFFFSINCCFNKVILSLSRLLIKSDFLVLSILSFTSPFWFESSEPNATLESNTKTFEREVWFT